MMDTDLEFQYPESDFDIEDYEDEDCEDYLTDEPDEALAAMKSGDFSHFSGNADVFFVDMDTARSVEPHLTAGKNIAVYVDNLKGLLEIQDEVSEWISGLKWISYDIETFHPDFQAFKRNEQPWWRKDLVGAFSLSDGKRTYVFKVGNYAFQGGMEWEHLRGIITLAFERGVAGHNLKFDLRFTYRIFEILPLACFDTFIAAKVIHCERKVFYGLKHVAAEYLGIKLSKEMQLSNWGGMLFTPEQVAYSGRDTWIVAKLVPIMTELMDKDPKYFSKNKDSVFAKVFGVRNKVAQLEFYLLPRLMIMEHNGISVDAQNIDVAYGQLRALETRLKSEFFTALGDKGRIINPNSPKKMYAYLTDSLGHLGFLRPDGNWYYLSQIETTDQDETKEFINKGFPLLDTFYNYKSTTGNIKRIEEFHACKDKVSSRLYTSFKQWGAISGRTSCPKPNLQNIKNSHKHGINLRHMFNAPPGRKLVVVDYSQIQLVIIAEISQDPVMLDIINNPQPLNNPEFPLMDLHIATAATVNGINAEFVTKLMRKEAKAANFGLCNRGTTGITTTSGVKLLKDVQIGDTVLTHKGNWKKVTHVYTRMLAHFYRITTITGKYVECSKEHRWQVDGWHEDADKVHPELEYDEDNTYWVETENLRKGDAIITPDLSECYGWKFSEPIEKIEQFSVPEELVYDITVEDDHSFIANGLVSHNCFGMGAPKFQEYARTSYELYYSEEQSREIRNRYFSLYKGVKQWHTRCSRTERGGKYYVESLYGRRIIADSFTKATNFPVQATEKDIVAFAISFIHDRLQREKVDGILVNCVHDEIICEAAEQDAPKVLQIMQEEMIRAGQLILKTVQVKAEGHIANYWDEAK